MTAKPRYDRDGACKTRQFSEAEWADLSERVRKNLRRFYPDQTAQHDETFSHPADTWANNLLSEANSAVSTVLWLTQRLTNEELRAEQQDVIRTLKRADSCLSDLSHDLDILLGTDADVLGCRDQIRKLAAQVEKAAGKIGALPTAPKTASAKSAAAVEMSIRVLRLLKATGIKISETADSANKYTSDAVLILKAIGDELGLVFAPLTWKSHIKSAREKAVDLQ